MIVSEREEVRGCKGGAKVEWGVQNRSVRRRCEGVSKGAEGSSQKMVKKGDPKRSSGG